MSFLSGAIFSETLNMDTNLGVILPQDSRWHRGIAPMAKGEPRPVPRTLILLHGLTDNWIAWAHRSRILSHAEAYDVAVLMPEVQRSFYQDMAHGEQYFSYITEELPKLAAQMFNIAVDPENLMIAGLSMGGYGALRCGLTYPERYRAVGAFSSACEYEDFILNTPERRETIGFDRIVRGILGDRKDVPQESKLEWLAEQAAKKGARAPFFMTCGTEDELFPGNEKMFRQMKELGLNVEFKSWPGIHEWGFWDKSIEMFLDKYV